MNKYDQLQQRLLESPEIKDIYETCIIKDITFKEWVIDHLDEMLIKGVLRCQPK